MNLRSIITLFSTQLFHMINKTLFSTKRVGTWNFKAYTFLSLPSNITRNDPTMLYEVPKKFRMLPRNMADNNIFLLYT